MNQQSSITTTQKGQQLIQEQSDREEINVLSNEDLVYQTGQILSGKFVESKQVQYNSYQKNQNNTNSQMLEKREHTYDTLQNVTGPDYNQHTIALESDSDLNKPPLQTRFYDQNRPDEGQIQLKHAPNKQIITTDLRSKLKNRNNQRAVLQQQTGDQTQQAFIGGGILSPIAVNIRSSLIKDSISPKNNLKKLNEESDQYFQNTLRNTSSKEIDNEWKSPLVMLSGKGPNNQDENLTLSQKLRKSRRGNSREELQNGLGKRKEDSRKPTISAGLPSFNLIPEESNSRGGITYQRRENKKETNVSGGSKVYPDKMKTLNYKQTSAYSQQSIGLEDMQKSMTLQVPGIRITNDDQKQQQQQMSQQHLSQFSPRNSKTVTLQTNLIKDQPKAKDLPQNTKNEKSESEPEPKGFFQFFRRLLKSDSKSNNTPQSSSGMTNPNLHNIPLHLQTSQHSNNHAITATFSNQFFLNNPSAGQSQLINPNLNGSSSNIPVSEINPGTNWNFVKKLAKVKRFIDSIKTSSLYQSFYKVKKNHLELISDKSDFNIVIEDSNQKINHSMHLTEAQQIQLKKNKKHKLYAALIRYLESLSQYIPLFLPHEPLLNWFKVAMLIITVITLVYVPLKGSFDLIVAMGTPEFYIIFLLPFLLYITEIFVTFNTAYYEEGDIQMNRMKIIQQYMKSTFVVDLISTVACYFLYVEQKLVCVFLVMVKLFKIGAYRREINEYFYIQQRSYTIYTLFNLILTVIVVAHYFACGFNYIAVIEEDYYHSNSWVETLGIDPTNWVSRYINSIYFSFITMVTVGFGDIKPTTDPEKVFVTLVALISSLIFAYTVNTIGTVFQEIAQQEAEYKSQKYHLSLYMRSRAINQQLQTRVMKYLDHMIHKQLESPEKGQEILKKMSKKIRDDIYKDFYGKILNNSKMFKFNFTEAFLKDLTVQMKEIICRPGEIIFSINECDNRIFFINKGEVQLFLEKYKKKDEQDNYSYNVLTKGDLFGEQSFFTSKLREISAKSLTVSHLIYCTYEDFVLVLRQYPKDYEKFCQIKDEVLNYEQQLNTRCTACQKFRHSIVDCPYVHLKKRRENVIHKHIRSIPNERAKPEEDRRKKKQNALQLNNNVRTKLRKLRKTYISQSNKKMKDDNSNIDDTKAGYNINVKKTQEEDDDLSETVLSEKPEELKRLSDKKFFLTTPKLYLDLQMQICVQNEDDEYIEEQEDPELQNDSQEIQIQDDEGEEEEEEEDDDVLEDDIDDEDEDLDDDYDENEDEDIQDEADDFEDEESSITNQEEERKNDFFLNPKADVIDQQALKNFESGYDLNEQAPPFLIKDSIFKTEKELISKKDSKNDNEKQSGVYITRKSTTEIDEDAREQQLKSSNQRRSSKKKITDDYNLQTTQQTHKRRSQPKIPSIQLICQESQKKQKSQPSMSEFERKERKPISKTLPQPPQLKFSITKQNTNEITNTGDYHQNKNNNLALPISPRSPNSTAIKSQQTSNAYLLSENGGNIQTEKEINKMIVYQREREQNEQTRYNFKKNKESADSSGNQQQLNIYSNVNSNNHSKSTSIAEQVYQSNNNKTNTSQPQGQLLTNPDYDSRNLSNEMQVPSIEYGIRRKTLEDQNEIKSLSYIPKQLNQNIQNISLKEKLPSLREVASDQDQSKIQTENADLSSKHNEQYKASQHIKSFENNLDLDFENEQKKNPSSLSFKSNPLEHDDSRSRSQEQKMSEGNNANEEESQSKSSSVTKRNKQDLLRVDSMNVKSYKDQNKLMFKGGLFSLKIAGISNKSPAKVISNQAQQVNSIENNTKNQGTHSSQLTIGSSEVFDELNSSLQHQQQRSSKQDSLSQINIGQHVKDEKQKQPKRLSEGETQRSRRRSKKGSSKLEQFQVELQAQSFRDHAQSVHIHHSEEKKQKKRSSQTHIKISNEQQLWDKKMMKQLAADQQGQNQESKKRNQSIDSGGSSRSSSRTINKNFTKQDSVKQKSTSISQNKDYQGILKQKRPFNITINTEAAALENPPTLILTPQSNRTPLLRKQTNKTNQSETPKNSFNGRQDQDSDTNTQREKHKRKEKKARILTTIVSPTQENVKQGMKNLFPHSNGTLKGPSGGNLLFPGSQGTLQIPTGNNLMLPKSTQNIMPASYNVIKIPQENMSVNEEKESKKIPFKRKGTSKNDSILFGSNTNNNNGNMDLLTIPIPQNIQVGSGINSNSYGGQSNMNSNTASSNSFSQAQQGSNNNQFLKIPNFKNQNDFSSAWMQQQQPNQQQQQQSLLSPNQQQIHHLLQIPNMHSFSFQNQDGATIQSQTPNQMNQQQQQGPQQQTSPHNTFKKQLSMNQYHNNNNNNLNPPSNPQLKTFNQQHSLKQQSGHAPSPSTNNMISPNQGGIRGDMGINQQQSQSNLPPQNMQSQQQIPFQNLAAAYQHMQSLPMNMQNIQQQQQMNMVMFPSNMNNNLLFQGNNNIYETNFNDDQYFRNQDYRYQKTLFIYDFDKMKEFTNYFPHNNYTLVCKEKKRVVNRKNFFASKKMGNSSRNIMQPRNQVAHPSPRGFFANTSFNASFRGIQGKQGAGGNNILSVQGNNGSLSNIPASNNVSMMKEGQNDQKLNASNSFNDKGKNKFKKATELLINSKRTSFRTYSKRGQRGGSDNVAIASYSNNLAPRNSSFFQIAQTENDIRALNNSTESKAAENDKNMIDSVRTESKYNETPKLESIESSNRRPDQLLLNQTSQDKCGISQFGIQTQQSSDYKQDIKGLRQQSNSIILDSNGNNLLKQEFVA